MNFSRWHITEVVHFWPLRAYNLLFIIMRKCWVVLYYTFLHLLAYHKHVIHIFFQYAHVIQFIRCAYIFRVKKQFISFNIWHNEQSIAPLIVKHSCPTGGPQGVKLWLSSSHPATASPMTLAAKQSVFRIPFLPLAAASYSNPNRWGSAAHSKKLRVRGKTSCLYRAAVRGGYPLQWERGNSICMVQQCRGVWSSG